MKKVSLLAIALLFSVAIFAQDPITHVINESFDAATLPEGWTTMGPDGNASSNWSISSTNYAGGDANELRLNWSPQFSGSNRIIAAPVDLTGIQNLVVKLDHYFENYSGATSTIGIATSTTNGYTWNTVWSQSYNQSGQYSIEKKITTPDMGYEDVLVCIYFEGTSSNFYNWYFDNFEVKIQEDLDIQLSSINIDERIGSGPLKVNFTVQNMGSTAIQSFEATYQIGEQEAVTETFSVYMTSFEENTLSFNTVETLLPGSYDINMNITKVNGWDEDSHPENNSLSNDFSVAISTTQRIPMIEHFSSSTCAPCVLLNSLMNNLCNNNPGKFTYTKYVVNWPGSGDPYFISESYDRCLFYNVSSVPQIFLDSELQVSNGTPQPVTNSKLSQRYAVPAFADVRGAFNVEGNVITLTADVMSYVDLNNVKTYITVNEKTTTENVGTNGETEFHHVIMKMLGGSEGNATTIKAGEHQRFEFSCDMSETNMEEINDLEVAVWVQDPTTKEIFNSRYLYEYTDHPYPVQNISITDAGNLVIRWTPDESANPTGYNVYVNNNLISSNTTELNYTIDNNLDFYTVEVEALYGEKSSVKTVKLLSTDFTTPQDFSATLNENIVEMSWTDIEKADKYNIYRNGILIATTEEAEFIDNSLTVNDMYCYQISAIYGNYESALTLPSCITFQGENINELESSLAVTPNPVNDYVRITGEDFNNVTIYNNIGVMIEKLNVKGNDIKIDMSQYNSGLYVIMINTEKGNIVKKIIKK
ncbi:MAG: T9SS type A sorting domain-containing protein [Bacteroidales bacterium]|nr:T9SS type A sorting domain-containing protein [Bacteroidales bacterium]